MSATSLHNMQFPRAEGASDATENSLELFRTLERDGVVVLPPLVDARTLAEMQASFDLRLRHMSFNNLDGYHRHEINRRMVEDVLRLGQGFVDIGLHPLVTAIARAYVGSNYQLSETKGWETLKTNVDFNSWHGDMWYDKTKITDHIPREVKLAFYLTDVRSGAFQYIKGSHQKKAPWALDKSERDQLDLDRKAEFLGPAGTAIMFDTSGIHRQGVPVLEPRRALFYNFHDASVPIQQEDIDYYRYHPLILNAAFLGNLTSEQQRVLGFGDKRRLQLDFLRKPLRPRLQRLLEVTSSAQLRLDELTGRINRRLRKLFRVNS